MALRPAALTTSLLLAALLAACAGGPAGQPAARIAPETPPAPSAQVATLAPQANTQLPSGIAQRLGSIEAMLAAIQVQLARHEAMRPSAAAASATAARRRRRQPRATASAAAARAVAPPPHRPAVRR